MYVLSYCVFYFCLVCSTCDFRVQFQCPRPRRILVFSALVTRVRLNGRENHPIENMNFHHISALSTKSQSIRFSRRLRTPTTTRTTLLIGCTRANTVRTRVPNEDIWLATYGHILGKSPLSVPFAANPFRRKAFSHAIWSSLTRCLWAPIRRRFFGIIK